MPSYFFITIICIITVIMITYEVYLFSKGRYYPYLTRDKNDSVKKIIIQTGLVLILSLCLYNLNDLPHNVSMLFAALVIISLALCTSILNYLSHRKIKDPKIIYQTVILDILVIALFLWIILI